MTRQAHTHTHTLTRYTPERHGATWHWLCDCGARQDGAALHGEVTLGPWTHPADAQEEVAQ